MPELAEVEYFRKRWSPAFGQTVARVELHAEKRMFRGVDTMVLVKMLTGSNLLTSERKAKQMLFRFTAGWLGVHLGMTGELLTAEPGFQAGKHEHLVIYTSKLALIFRDPRIFGRVRFSPGNAEPDWWMKLPPELSSAGFNKAMVARMLSRRSKSALKAVLLMQELFPGIGNWMADEILWQAKLSPRLKAGELTSAQMGLLTRTIKKIVRQSLATIGEDFGDPPEGWLFHERWSSKGVCPKHQQQLTTATIGGRTTRWCERCQPVTS